MGSASDSEALYNDDLGEEISLDPRVYAPSQPKDLTGNDFGDLINFRSVIGEEEAKAIQKRYPFRRGYDLGLSRLDDRAHLPLEDTVVVYVEQLEVGL